MKTIKIELDFLLGPIVTDVFDASEMRCITGIPVIDNDEEIEKLNSQISDLYSSFYEFDSHEQPCYFNEEELRKNKTQLINLLKQLINRLNKINDGSFKVVEHEIERLEKL